MKLKRLASFGSALVLSLSSLAVLTPTLVHAAVVTWTGAGTDSKFSTPANWSGSVAPVAGDSLVFPALGTKQAPINDTTLAYTGMTFSGVSGTCSAEPYAWYSFTGTSPLSISGTIANDMTGSCSNVDLRLDVTLTGNLSVTGAGYVSFGTGVGTLALGSNTLTTNGLTIDGPVSGSTASSIIKNGTSELYINGSGTAFSGSIVVNGGALSTTITSLGASSGVTVNAAASLFVAINKNATLNTPITLNGASGGTNIPKLQFDVYGDQADYATGVTSLLSATYAGPLTLGSDTTLGLSLIRNKITLTGALSGAYKITRLDGEAGKIALAAAPNGSQTANGDLLSARKEYVVATDQASGFTTSANSQTTINEGKTVTGNSEVREDGILIIKGKIVGTLLVKDDGIVKGSGVIQGPLTLSERAKLAPGLSPGCLSTGNLTFAAGTSYDFELGGATACTEYDQTKVTGTVTLGNGTLNTILFNGYKPKAGEKYTIIDNDGTDAVIGTFNNLAEGADVTVNGYVLTITYKGGDGNDVVLSVKNIPTTPNTGFQLISSHPLMVAASTTVLAGAIVLISRRYKKLLGR